MKSALKTLKSLSLYRKPNTHILRRLYSAIPNTPTSEDEEPAFDSSQFTLPIENPENASKKPAWGENLKEKEVCGKNPVKNVTWDESLREKANRVVAGGDKGSRGSRNLGEKAISGEKPAENVKWDESLREKAKRVVSEEGKGSRVFEREEERKRKAAVLAKALLEAALDGPDDDESEGEDEEVREEDQKSLNVGIIGAPNAGKSCLTNFMVGTKVAAVSRKTNTTTHEVLGVMTHGSTQICFFDTPGLMLKKSGFPSADMKFRVKSAWSSINLYDVLIVIFDVHRHLQWPDSRVVKLIERMGSEVNPNQKRVLCMNKVDLVEKKKDLLKVAEQFKDLPAYDKYFMISGLKGSGVKDLSQFLLEQAVKRPWEEDPFTMSEEVMKNISLEVVRERLLDHVHQEIPYNIEHRLVDWKELRDGSLRIEQHLVTPKMSQRKILIGKNGSKIGRIGMEANEELRSIFKRNVHLILMYFAFAFKSCSFRLELALSELFVREPEAIHIIPLKNGPDNLK